jgi:spore germination cell wall hydrolase CwlJ-like protein
MSDFITVTKTETENITIDTNTNNNSETTQPNLNQVNLGKIIETTTNSLNISNIKDVSIENTESEIEAETFYYGKRYNYNFSENDMILMCTVVSSETGYCADKEQKAVAHTILNRLKSKDFPDTIYEVVTQKNQYTAVHGYFDGQYREGLYPGSELWNHTMKLCYEAIDEWDFTCGAVAYYNPKINGYNDWFESLNLVYEDDCGRFFAI